VRHQRQRHRAEPDAVAATAPSLGRHVADRAEGRGRARAAAPHRRAGRSGARDLLPRLARRRFRHRPDDRRDRRPVASPERSLIFIGDSQVHIWGAATREPPWPTGRGVEAQKPYPVTRDMLLFEMELAKVSRIVLVPPSWEGDRNDLAL